MPLEGLRWSRDSGSALYDTPQTAVLGRAGGANLAEDTQQMYPEGWSRPRPKDGGVE